MINRTFNSYFMGKLFLLALLLMCNYGLVLGQEPDEDDTVGLTSVNKKLPDNYILRSNVIYTSSGNWKGYLDLYCPGKNDKPVPIVINIHGGGWVKGSKESQRGLFDDFFANGYAVANIEYRLAGIAPAPAAVEDVRCALSYLYEHADELNIDTSKFVVMGVSAGAHLALMAGLLGNAPIFSKKCPDVCKIKVAAIIDKCGVTDVSGVLKGENKRKWAITWLNNNIENKNFIKSVSPISYVSKNSPPTLIIHSNQDPVVPYQQSVSFHQKLKDLNVKTEFYTVFEKAHGTFSKEESQKISSKIISFLKGLGI